MDYRDLGDSGLKVSEVMLGTWAMGGTQWGPTDDSESIAAIRRAVELGITSIDTAPAYGHGHAEELVGKAIKEYPREQLQILTKTGLGWDEQRPYYIDNSPKFVLDTIDDSLRRLEIDCIDVLQIHWPDPNVPVEDTLGAMVKLQEAGKIRHIGVCNFDVPLLERAVKVAKIVSLQNEYSLMKRSKVEPDVLPFCREHGIGIITYGSLMKGMLSGKFRGDETFPENDVRHRDPRFQGEAFRENVAKVEKMKEIAARYGKTPAELAIRWILEHPGIASAIVGAKKPSQVEDNAGATGWRLSDDDMAALELIFA